MLLFDMFYITYGINYVWYETQDYFEFVVQKGDDIWYLKLLEGDSI